MRVRALVWDQAVPDVTAEAESDPCNRASFVVETGSHDLRVVAFDRGDRVTVEWTVHPVEGGQLSGGSLTLPARSVQE